MFIKLLNYYRIKMPKKIVSVALSEESYEKIEQTSKALGMNRSELIEYMIKQGWYFSDEIVELVDKIKHLQNQAEEKLGEE